MKLILDGKSITGREALLEKMEKAFDFPEWFGGNLDALYDCLGDLMEEVDIEIVDYAALEANLGDYAGRVLRVLQDAANVNLNIQITGV